ncbi:MAG: phosphotransferase [Rhodospirillales bacterium]
MALSGSPEARAGARKAFLDGAGWGDAPVEALPGDASFRRYFRLGGEQPALLMDAPPDKEDVRPYIRIARHLVGMGFSAPAILAADEDQGFCVIEDFGDATYTRLLAAGHDERKLYDLAVDVLAALHGTENASAIDLPTYDEQRLLDEAGLLVDWYLPALTGEDTPAGVRESYLDAWRSVLQALPPGPETLVLRDYHVDNLMLIDGREGLSSCGLLDFQDAVIGHPAYDLMSLLEDARRDIDDDLRDHLRQRYAAARPEAASPDFEQWFTVLAAQRHAKVIGIFTRLKVRDGKPVYLPHIPRVLGLLRRALRHPALAPVAGWCTDHMPGSDRMPEFR